jgi:RimJ/RimL family protein N-acetyltransferase
MDPQDGQDAKADIRDVRIRGSRLLLRALQPGEIEEEWQAMVTADPMVIAALPEEAAFKARLRRSGHLEDGWLDLAIDLDGVSIGRIQTFVPSRWTLPPGTFGVGIGLREDARGKGYGREALALLTDWLFERATAEAVEASTDPANTAMRTVFRKAGWRPVGSRTEPGREWVMYRMTRQEWEDSLQAWCRTATRLPRLTSAAGPP